jgi:hypothetical protein
VHGLAQDRHGGTDVVATGDQLLAQGGGQPPMRTPTIQAVGILHEPVGRLLDLLAGALRVTRTARLRGLVEPRRGACEGWRQLLPVVAERRLARDPDEETMESTADRGERGSVEVGSRRAVRRSSVVAKGDTVVAAVAPGTV